MSLLKAQVMELQVDNAKIDQAKSTMIQSTAMGEHVPQASSKSRSHEDKKDSVEEIRKEKTTTRSKDITMVQGVDTATKKNIEASRPQQQRGVASTYQVSLLPQHR